MEVDSFLSYANGTVWTILRSTDGFKAHATRYTLPQERNRPEGVSGKTRRTA
jgi:hypothetical protein